MSTVTAALAAKWAFRLQLAAESDGVNISEVDALELLTLIRAVQEATPQ